MSLLAAAFLAGLAALAVPLWLHFVSRSAGQPTPVSSLLLMRPAEAPARHRRSLAHRVLLALRLALLAVLALAFAQPVLPGGPVAAARVEAPGLLVAVDASLSMRRAEVWAQAVATAEALLDQDAEARLVLLGERARFLPGAAALARSPAAAEERSGPGFTRVSFASMPGRLAAAVATLPERAGGWQAHLVSDFQASAMPTRFNALVEGLSTPLVLHPVAGAEENFAVEAVARGPDRIAARVQSHAAETRSLAVALRGPDGAVERRELSMPPGARRLVEFELPLGGAAPTPWQLVIDVDDALAEDNVGRIVQAAATGQAVAVVTDDPDADAVQFVVAALDSVGVDVEVVAADAAWADDAAALVVVDAAPRPALQARLERHLEGGGGALFVVGPRTSRHGALPLGEPLGEPRPFADRLGAAAGPLNVLAVDKGHPVAEGSWNAVTVARALAPEAAVPTEAIILGLASDGAEADIGGAPLLVERRLGKGRALTLYTSLDRTWSSLALRPVFVAFMHNAVAYLSQAVSPVAYAGQPLSLAGASVQIFDGDGRRALTLDRTLARSSVSLPAPGFYTVRSPGRQSLLAVQLDLRESDLGAAPAETLDRWQSAAAALGSPAPQPGVADAGAELPLAPWLLALAALLLLVECLAGNTGPTNAPWRAAAATA